MDEAGTYTLRVVDQDGALLATPDAFTIETIGWQLNGYGFAKIRIPTLDEALAQLVSITGDILNELQVWRNGAFLAWFAITDAAPDALETVLECADVGWYLTKRHVGDFRDRNLLTEPDFEVPGATLTAWTMSSGLASGAPQTSVNAMAGNRVLRLEAPDSDGTQVFDRYAKQVYVLPVDDVDAEDYSLSGYAWPDPLEPFAAGTYNAGLALALWNGTTYIASEWRDGGQLTDETSRTYWTRLRANLQVPARTSSDHWELHVLCFCPGGVVYWDYLRLTKTERLEYRGVDQVLIAEGLIEHAQDPALNKADLNIGTDCTPGIHARLRNRVWPWCAHDNIWDELVDLSQDGDGFDFAVICTAATRTFTTYPDGRGVVDPDVTLQWGGPEGNIAAWPGGISIAGGASSVLVMGDGSTDETGRRDEREWVWALDEDALGGRLLESVETKPGGPYVSISQMLSYAQAKLDEYRAAASLTITTHRHDAADFAAMIQAGTLAPGDNVAVNIEHGWVTIADTMRVVQLELNPATEQVTFTVVPVRTGS